MQKEKGDFGSSVSAQPGRIDVCRCNCGRQKGTQRGARGSVHPDILTTGFSVAAKMKTQGVCVPTNPLSVVLIQR